jgi:bifunctional enzyme CysN/CysC
MYMEENRKKVQNLVWQKVDITREIRADKMRQKPVTIWFTGLSGAGKSTLANEIEKVLNNSGKYTMLLDGDNVRMGLCNDLGFSEKDRIENIRRIAEVARLMNDAGLIVLSSFISPYINDRRKARAIIGNDNFVEVYVSTPLEECEKRDTKGLYKKARVGMISNFTGISSPYEEPQNPEIVINTSKNSIEESVNILLKEIQIYL